MISPSGPLPVSAARSTPCSRASRRTNGEITGSTAGPAAPATTAGATATGAAGATGATAPEAAPAPTRRRRPPFPVSATPYPTSGRSTVSPSEDEGPSDPLSAEAGAPATATVTSGAPTAISSPSSP